VVPKKRGKPGVLIYHVNSANVISHAELRGVYGRQKKGDRFEVLFSADSLNWIPIFEGKAKGKNIFKVGFGTKKAKPKPQNLARTRTGYYLKFVLQTQGKGAGCGLFDLEIKTITVLNPRTLPRLTLGSNRVKIFRESGEGAPLEITYHWTEFTEPGGVVTLHPKSHGHRAAKKAPEYYINTGGFRWPAMDSVTVAWAGNDKRFKEGYGDGRDVGEQFESPTYFLRFGRNIGWKQSVSASPQLDGVDRLTNGHDEAREEMAEWGTGTHPEVVIRLGKAKRIQGVSIAQSIITGDMAYLDSAIVLTSNNGKQFERKAVVWGSEVWRPITNSVYPNKWDAPLNLKKRNAGILFHKFYGVFKARIKAKFVKIQFYNHKGPLRIAEVEVFDEMVRTPIRNEVAHGFSLEDKGFALAKK